MSQTVHYIPFATDYQRLLPPVTRMDTQPDRVVIVHQQLPNAPADHLDDLKKTFKSQLEQEQIQVESEELNAPYEFRDCFQKAYQDLRGELEAGHSVYVNAAAIPELVGLSYISASRMLASELRTDSSVALDTIPEEATISTYYSAPNSFPALEFLARRQALRRINESLADLGSLTDHVQVDREFADIVVTLFNEDEISTLIEALESVTTDEETTVFDDLYSGLVDMRDGLEQFTDGLNTLGNADITEAPENPEVIGQLTQTLLEIDAIEGLSTFETLQTGADRIGSDPASMFGYFNKRLEETETFVEDANPLGEDEFEELIDISERVGNHGLTSGHRKFNDGSWTVVLPNDLDPDLSPFQHAMVYTLAVADNELNSITELTCGLLEFILEDPDFTDVDIEWSRSQIEYRLPPSSSDNADSNDSDSWKETVLTQADSTDDPGELIPSLRSKVQYNLDNFLETAGFIEGSNSKNSGDDVDKRVRTPRLTTAAKYWAAVHYEPIDTV